MAVAGLVEAAEGVGGVLAWWSFQVRWRWRLRRSANGFARNDKAGHGDRYSSAGLHSRYHGSVKLNIVHGHASSARAF
jgi:hypothetical protein